MLQSAGAAGYATSTQLIIGGIGAGGAGALFGHNQDEANDASGIANNPPNRR